MLEKAAKKKIYDRLEAVDILQDWEFPQKFDLIYSSDVFVYFGNLDPVIRSASSYLVSSGIIAFSVERLDDPSMGHRLFPSGRYAHSRAYIQDVLSRHALHRGDQSRYQEGVRRSGQGVIDCSKEILG
jgi:predicted TPR repeat methyltransferase